MSRYVSRTLAYRRQEDQARRVANRIAICVVLLMLAVGSACIAYLFLGYTDQIAAATHDKWETIGMLGITAVVVSFGSLVFTVLVAFGLHE